MNQSAKQKIYSHGKLLLFGEYAVLDGATALAIPTRRGQSLEITSSSERVIEQNTLSWQSLDFEGKPWFTTTFTLEELLNCTKDYTSAETAANIPLTHSDDPIRNRLLHILSAALRLSDGSGIERLNQKAIRTHLEFPREWGLGTSSTLLANLARLFEIDPYQLSDQTLGGSGYDLACAQATGPIFYTRQVSGTPIIEPAPFKPVFADKLYFVFSGTKQDSRAGIRRYREQLSDTNSLVASLTEIGKAMAITDSLEEFQEGMLESEALLAQALALKPIQERMFTDYPGAIKSLGAWGGDFILAAGHKNTPEYFHSRGYRTVLSYAQMALAES